MKFGQFPVAAGLILAHAMTLPDGRRIKKGSVLDDAAVEMLVASGVTTVIAAVLDHGDVGEDEASRRIAQGLASDTIRAEMAATGRVNLYAMADGLFRADRSLVDAMNRVDAGITLATLADNSVVHAGRMVATVKIIPYGVADVSVARVCDLARKQPVGIDRFRAMRIGVVSTMLPSLKASVMDKTIRVLEGRLKVSGSTVSSEIRTAHDEGEVEAAMRKLAPNCDVLIVFGASAICDIGDVIPAAIVSAGGRIEHFGMPVDPGNLLLIGEAFGIPVIGAPGCARSPAENGFDWVLDRILCGRKVTAQEITGMGVGGLLMEIGIRPQPREAVERERRKFAILVLAAGMSRRMGPANKLLAEIGGKAMVRHVVEAAVECRPENVQVVCGHEAKQVKEALAGFPVQLVSNPRYAEGMGTSLAAGIAALEPTVDGVLVLLSDMPGITAPMIERLLEAGQQGEETPLVVASADGKRGNPVLLPRKYFSALERLKGDEGARALVGENWAEAVVVELGPAAAQDYDTPEALADAQIAVRDRAASP